MKMRSEEIIQTLKKCGLFGELSDEELSSIADLGSIEHFASGDQIYRQGDIVNKLYILSEGQVSLHRSFEIGQDRQAENVVYVLRESPCRRLLGSWSTLVGEVHTQLCSAICNKPTKVVSFNSSELRDLISKQMNIRIKILEKLVVILRERLESSYSSMETL
jgi:signal-transduction protein with cAMP-binding, CBS, and nucleotidyltransferase domain